MTRPATTRAPRRRLSAALAALVLLAAACAGNEATTPPTVATNTVPAVAATTTTAAPTTAPTTTPTTTGTTYDDVETAIREAHTRVMTELFARDERVTGPEAILPLAEELTIDPLLQRLKENLARKVDSGERSVGPGYDSHIIEVQILDESSARVFDCSLGQNVRYSADGDLLIKADDYYKIRQSVLVRTGERWVVSDVYIGGDNRCDPPA